MPKADGSFRFCTDFRKINSVTVPDAFAQLRIDDCIDSLGAAKYITKLDLLKGYWQVPLTERTFEISAYVTPDSFLQYMRMAFAPAACSVMTFWAEYKVEVVVVLGALPVSACVPPQLLPGSSMSMIRTC